jgi:hypothetical protein
MSTKYLYRWNNILKRRKKQTVLALGPPELTRLPDLVALTVSLSVAVTAGTGSILRDRFIENKEEASQYSDLSSSPIEKVRLVLYRGFHVMQQQHPLPRGAGQQAVVEEEEVRLGAQHAKPLIEPKRSTSERASEWQHPQVTWRS